MENSNCQCVINDCYCDYMKQVSRNVYWGTCAFLDQVKRLLKTRTHELGIKERFAAGSVAGVFSQSAIYPLEVG